MYYLRKKSYEQIIPEIKKNDGTIIPERKYMTGDRAVYKDNKFGRFYRDQYPFPHNKGVHLYKVKKLSTIMSHRQWLYNHCGEWFDIYDENGKVNISEYN